LTEISIAQALRESVVEVLERMFFIEASEEADDVAAAEDPKVQVELNFEGDPPGAFRLSLARGAAALIAADFLGEDAGSVSPRQVDDVARELTNMICGAVLSRVESSVTFRLAPPAILPDAAPWIADTSCTVETGNGPLTAGILMEPRACTPIEKSAS
jgi:CheY-specific phosphatase CheX